MTHLRIGMLNPKYRSRDGRIITSHITYNFTAVISRLCRNNPQALVVREAIDSRAVKDYFLNQFRMFTLFETDAPTWYPSFLYSTSLDPY